MNPRLERRLRALLALSRGDDHEATAAARHLERTLSQHGLTLQDLEDQAVETYQFPYRSNADRKLVFQVLYAVNPEAKTYKYTRGKRRSPKIGADLTKGEKLEVDLRLRVYRKALAQEQERVFCVYWRDL